MPSRNSATSEATDNDADTTVAAEAATNSDALALALAEAEAAEATAAAARARAEVLRLQHGRAEEPTEATPPAEDEAPEEPEAPAEPEPSEPDDAAAAADEADRSGRLRRVWKPLRWVAATLTVLAVGGLIAASVLMVLHDRGVQQRQRQAGEYMAAERQGVVTLMSLNFNTVDDDVKRILDNSTGEFKKDFEKQAGDFVKLAKESKAVTEATATFAAIDSMTDHDATVLVAANTKVSNSGGAVDEPRNWRLAVKVVREGDRVKMSSVEFVP
ncbi:hypothetical protein [Mycobacterium talmoniae]|uniref:Mammalian cell entry protein n=1 Tax=Mycobacterium talmoniae TaxID=1858794 RepID=A0A1S1NRR0_9MYCO|nr:hypothetical protein [Mycobacterium talmoniae]OHV06430.1 hypothetical protein BKN37_02340 [Mycobacterium talmoniae]